MHTWLVAICLGLKTDRPLWQTWSKHYLWSSLTYFVGAFLAGGIVKLENTISFYAVLQQRSFSERDLIISVNLSAKQLMEHDLVQRIAEVLQETQLKPWHLKLEVTESVVMENPEIAAITLGKLRALGVLLSIDDFGTGYSSLSYLNRFPLDILKIDRSFISTMNQNDENLQIVKTIVTLAGNLGMEVIAEGVETEEQLNQLRLLRCQYAQGFLFSQPMNAMDADLFILNRVNSPAALPIPEAPGFVM
jgi:EAL domain-containing protein (putative c-di-GMP-specific phosphodiesterase class I)